MNDVVVPGRQGRREPRPKTQPPRPVAAWEGPRDATRISRDCTQAIGRRAILGGGRVPMISNLLDTLINQIPRWEQAAAISTILLIVTLLIFAAYRRLDRKASA